ncbi:MAG TPA: 2-phosphosulfolactate phosphatase [Anaerolineales bacterium]|nr:2-phosphosulfolactate phosphatase [Anaerolineales bacterium]
MKFHYTNLDTCHEAMGVVVVIDVIRAFTNAAFAFSRGAKEIYPVSGVEEALILKAQTPNSLACGEVGGLPPEGFDFGNSPSQTSLLDLNDKIIIQRTGAGTQGITRSLKADTVFAASFVVAHATVQQIQKLNPVEITFVATGQTYDGGEEDLACAEYLEALLLGKSSDPAFYLDRVWNSADARVFHDPQVNEFPKLDISHCTSLDKFDFAMPVTRSNGRHVMRAVKP